MPIGKLLTLPDVSSSTKTNFPRRYDSSYHCEDDAEESYISNDRSDTKSCKKPSVGDGDQGQNRQASSFSNLRNDGDNKSKILVCMNNNDVVYSDGDHAITLDEDLSYQSHFEKEVEKCMQKNDSRSTPISLKLHHSEPPVQSSHSKDKNGLYPVFLPKGTFFSSYSETDIPQPGDNKCVSRRDSCTDPIGFAASLTSTLSQTDEDDIFIDDDFKQKLTKELQTLEETTSILLKEELLKELETLEQKKSILLKEIEESTDVIEKCNKSTILSLSSQHIELRMTSEVRDICNVISDISTRENEANVPERQAILLTTTPEMNQIIVGSLTGWVGAYAAKNFGKTMITAIGGGIFVSWMANQCGYVKINWTRIYDDLNLSLATISQQPQEASLSRSNNDVAGTSTARETEEAMTIVRKYPYAVGGFVGGFCAGLIS